MRSARQTRSASDPFSRSTLQRSNAPTIFGGHKAVVRPDPIPNSAVKHSLADGSSPIGSARVGCRQFFKKAETQVSAFFIDLQVIQLKLIFILGGERSS